MCSIPSKSCPRERRLQRPSTLAAPRIATGSRADLSTTGGGRTLCAWHTLRCASTNQHVSGSCTLHLADAGVAIAIKGLEPLLPRRRDRADVQHRLRSGRPPVGPRPRSGARRTATQHPTSDAQRGWSIPHLRALRVEAEEPRVASYGMKHLYVTNPDATSCAFSGPQPSTPEPKASHGNPEHGQGRAARRAARRRREGWPRASSNTGRRPEGSSPSRS